MYSRQLKLLGEQKLNKLQNRKVAIIGLGGVGGYVVEMLARAGVKHILVCDGDNIDISNLNRQIIAIKENVGSNKAIEFKKRIHSINNDIEVTAVDKHFSVENMLDLKGYDYVIDAIDSINDKVELIVYCTQNNIPIISAMGAGNRIEVCDFEIIDVYKTKDDGLAKKLRSLLRKKGVQKLNVASATKPAIKDAGAIGSICYTPALSGIKIAAFVINELLR